MIAKRVKQVILIGQAKEELRQALEGVGYHQYSEADTYEEVVRLAAQAAEPGDIVLLSPACASWDMFNSYEERGRLFKELVNGLAE